MISSLVDAPDASASGMSLISISFLLTILMTFLVPVIEAAPFVPVVTSSFIPGRLGSEVVPVVDVPSLGDGLVPSSDDAAVPAAVVSDTSLEPCPSLFPGSDTLPAGDTDLSPLFDLPSSVLADWSSSEACEWFTDFLASVS